jgi:hypothetical protein
LGVTRWIRKWRLGLEYLKSEPLTEYEERKKKAPEPGGAGGRGMRPPAGAEVTSNATPPAAGDVAAKPAAAPAAEVADAAPQGGQAGGAGAPAAGDMAIPDANPAAAAAAAAFGDGGFMGMGMMGGFGARRGGPAGPPPVKYEATVWGRYAKVLLSSSEFLFIN